MKKTIAILIALVMTLTSLIPAFAAKESVLAQSKTINEYQSIKELKQKNDNELKKQGYNDEDIKQIRELDYAAELKRRAKLDEQTLKNYGYTSEQVKALKSFKGTEDEIITLAATLTFDAYHVKFLV